MSVSEAVAARPLSGETPTPSASEDALAQIKAERKARRWAASAWLAQASGAGRWAILGAGLAGSLKGAAIIAQAWLLAEIMHLGIVDGAPLMGLWPFAAGLAAAMLLRALFVYLQEAAGAQAARAVGRTVHSRLMSRILDAGPAFTRTRESGVLATSAIENILALEGYVARYRPQMIIVAIVPLMILAAVAQANWVVAALFAVTGPLVPLFMGLVGMGAAAASAQQFETLARMGGHFLDRFRGLTTLKLFGQATVEQEAMVSVAESFRQRTMKVLRIAFLSSAVLEFFSTVAVALVALYVGLGLLGMLDFLPGAADMTLRTGLFVLLLAPEFFQPLRQFGAFYHDRASALGAAEALVDILPPEDRKAGEDKPQSAPPTLKSPPEIRFEDVALHYPGGRKALESVTLTIAPGETLGLMGPSGAGKSSLIDLVLGFQMPSAGSLRVEGRVVTPQHRAWLQHSCAWAGQRPTLFYATIAENIALGICDPDDPQVRRAAEAARVMDFAKEMPQGLETMIGERGFGLSGGQARRVAIARAFLKDAPILLLDEPTANLDRQTERLVIEALKDLVRNRTTILCTHSADAAAIASRVVRIDRGRISDASGQSSGPATGGAV